MDIKSGIAMVIFVWVGIGVCFGVAWLMAKIEPWVHPVVVLGIIGTLMAFFGGSLIGK